MRRLAPVRWNGGQVLALLVLRQGTKIKRPTRINIRLKALARHVFCRRSAPLLAIAPIKRSVDTRAHVQAPSEGIKIKRATGTYFQLIFSKKKYSFFKCLSFDAKQYLLQLWLQSMVFNLVVKPNQRFTKKRINKSELEMFH